MVPGSGPLVQFSSNFVVTRSGEGKQIGLTHRLNISGCSNRNNDTSLIIANKNHRQFSIIFNSKIVTKKKEIYNFD